MDSYLGYRFTEYGLYPRKAEGLTGLLTMHFIHGSLEHIWHNTLGFLVLNSFLFYFYRSVSLRVFLFVFLTSGLLLWFIGRPNYHIGASMLIYAEFAFLLVSGFIRKNPKMLRVSLVVTLYYGSLVWYLFPIDSKISWEGHLSGFVAGIIAAVLFRKLGPQRTVYRYELEPEEEEENTSGTDPVTNSTLPASPASEYLLKYHRSPPG